MLSARQKLEFGMDLSSAFGIGTSGKNDFCRIPGFENALFYAQKGGSKADVFAKIAGEIKLRDDQKRKICMSLIEPAFIGLTGLFLIGLVMNYVLPVIESMGMFL